jgi:hypothetical protein
MLSSSSIQPKLSASAKRRLRMKSQRAKSSTTTTMSRERITAVSVRTTKSNINGSRVRQQSFDGLATSLYGIIYSYLSLYDHISLSQVNNKWLSSSHRPECQPLNGSYIISPVPIDIIEHVTNWCQRLVRYRPRTLSIPVHCMNRKNIPYLVSMRDTLRELTVGGEELTARDFKALTFLTSLTFMPTRVVSKDIFTPLTHLLHLRLDDQRHVKMTMTLPESLTSLEFVSTNVSVLISSNALTIITSFKHEHKTCWQCCSTHQIGRLH